MVLKDDDAPMAWERGPAREEGRDPVGAIGLTMKGVRTLCLPLLALEGFSLSRHFNASVAGDAAMLLFCYAGAALVQALHAAENKAGGNGCRKNFIRNLCPF